MSRKPKMHLDLAVRKVKQRVKELCAEGDTRDRVFLAHSRNPNLIERIYDSGFSLPEWVALFRADGCCTVAFDAERVVLIGGFAGDAPTVHLEARTDVGLKPFRQQSAPDSMRSAFDEAARLVLQPWGPAAGSEVLPSLESAGQRWELSYPALREHSGGRYRPFWRWHYPYNELDAEGKRTGRVATVDVEVAPTSHPFVGLAVVAPWSHSRLCIPTIRWEELQDRLAFAAFSKAPRP